MSHRLIVHSGDLRRLREEGLDVTVVDEHLHVRQVPFATAEGTVARGTLVSELTTQGETTARPGSHTVWFVGGIPCDDHGNELGLVNGRQPRDLGRGTVASCRFSQKPKGGYVDYYVKMSTYVDILEGYARALDPSATARVFPPIPASEEESVFRYLDSATSRAEIGAVTDRLRGQRIAIVGLGGTGSYILDLVAKTPVSRIDLYDSDAFETHNAFRAPGAASLEDLNSRLPKVEYWERIYDRLHRHIVVHPEDVTDANIEKLRDATFVFIAADGGEVRQFIARKLIEFGVPFVDSGMGVYQQGTQLGGQLRTTTWTGDRNDAASVLESVPSADEDPDDPYTQNIQIADLNMLAAALAVIRWKRHVGFYLDFEEELLSAYAIDGNHLLNDAEDS